MASRHALPARDFFLFFQLPAEIRNMVYEFVTVDDHFYDNHKNLRMIFHKICSETSPGFWRKTQLFWHIYDRELSENYWAFGREWPGQKIIDKIFKDIEFPDQFETER